MDHQNDIRVRYQPDTQHWRARIGPNDERGREAEGLMPIEAFCALIVLLQWDGYKFNPDAEAV